MAYDERLAQRIRQTFGTRPDVAERKMFGGLTFLCDGRMCCGVVGADLMVRVAEDELLGRDLPAIGIDLDHLPVLLRPDAPRERGAELLDRGLGLDPAVGVRPRRLVR